MNDRYTTNRKPFDIILLYCTMSNSAQRLYIYNNIPIVVIPDMPFAYLRPGTSPALDNGRRWHQTILTYSFLGLFDNVKIKRVGLPKYFRNKLFSEEHPPPVAYLHAPTLRNSHQTTVEEADDYTAPLQKHTHRIIRKKLENQSCGWLWELILVCMRDSVFLCFSAQCYTRRAAQCPGGYIVLYVSVQHT